MAFLKIIIKAQVNIQVCIVMAKLFNNAIAMHFSLMYIFVEILLSSTKTAKTAHKRHEWIAQLSHEISKWIVFVLASTVIFIFFSGTAKQWLIVVLVILPLFVCDDYEIVEIVVEFLRTEVNSLRKQDILLK